MCICSQFSWLLPFSYDSLRTSSLTYKFKCHFFQWSQDWSEQSQSSKRLKVHKILQNSCVVPYLWGHAHVCTELVSHLGKSWSLVTMWCTWRWHSIRQEHAFRFPLHRNRRGEKGAGSYLGLTQVMDVIRVYAWLRSLTELLGLSF